MSGVLLAHLSDLHFGEVADLQVLEGAVTAIAALRPAAVVVSGDLTLRARHGEFQAAHLYLDRLKAIAPVLAVPGNHDVQWWRSPFHLLGTSVLHRKHRRWFGQDLTPGLIIPGVHIAGALSANGIALGSLTFNPNDMAVKGNLPRSETKRLTRVFQGTPQHEYRVAVLHHNVLRGNLSQRMGLSHWRSAGRRLVACGADVVLCGHDHEEGTGLLENRIVVSTASTLSTRVRGERPASFNVVRLLPDRVEVGFQRWDKSASRFLSSDLNVFARPAAESGSARVPAQP
ncbi:MAG TPA: metallophosphoesterase [Gemmatimonadales bacterium]|nr:metallophosphoesterase [Gemmatimonadales bacterium]